MLEVTKLNEVFLTRGDTAWLLVELEDDNGQPYEIQPNEILTLTVKKTCEDKEALIEKKVSGTAEFYFRPEDTKSLVFGSYRYDVQLTDASSPESILIEKESFDDLEHTIKKDLSDFEYQVLCEFLSGKSYAEIADSLGVASKSVDNALRRIRSKIKK